MTRSRPGSSRALPAGPGAAGTPGAPRAGGPTATTTVTDGIAHVRLDRPGRRDALTPDTLSALASKARLPAADRTLRVVVLSGAGEGFSTGLAIPAALRAPGPAGRALPPMPSPRPSAC